METELRIVLSLLCDIQRECQEQEIGYQLPATNTCPMYKSTFDDGLFIGYLYLMHQEGEYSCDTYISFSENQIEFIYDSIPNSSFFCSLRDNRCLHDAIGNVKISLELSM